MSGMDAGETELKKELDATLRARRELGEEYDSALVESFLEKVDQRIDSTVDRRVRRHLGEQQLVVARGSQRPRPTDSWGSGSASGWSRWCWRSRCRRSAAVSATCRG